MIESIGPRTADKIGLDLVRRIAKYFDQEVWIVGRDDLRHRAEQRGLVSFDVHLDEGMVSAFEEIAEADSSHGKDGTLCDVVRK